MLAQVTPFELNCRYHPSVSFKDEGNARFRSFLVNELVIKLRELINVYYQKLLHTQNLHKQAPDKGVKPCSYAPNEKVWLNSKYIMIK